MKAGEGSEYQAYGNQLSQFSFCQSSSLQILSRGQKRSNSPPPTPKNPLNVASVKFLHVCYREKIGFQSDEIGKISKLA